jgi:hypothetical protein
MIHNHPGSVKTPKRDGEKGATACYLESASIGSLSGAGKDHVIALLAFDSYLVHTWQQEAELELFGWR